MVKKIPHPCLSPYPQQQTIANICVYLWTQVELELQAKRIPVSPAESAVKK
ncbi:hypothetical protein H6F73_24470 [Microcoleus sp. FACHB-68]|nr:hypothetical protein [Microcoleus sp. FACHB-68]